MFVRWKRNTRSKRKFKNQYVLHTLIAVLVECKRENGKIKQNYLGYLASIRENLLDSTCSQKLFWGKINSRLSELEIDEQTRQQIIVRIQEVVPSPDL
jgi:hypothetical protein